MGNNIQDKRRATYSQLTDPDSNLLMLFWECLTLRIPLSPLEPNMVQNTLASVPAPLSLPVRIVNLYGTTEAEVSFFILHD